MAAGGKDEGMSEPLRTVQRDLDALAEHLRGAAEAASAILREVQGAAAAGVLRDDRDGIHPAATVATVVTAMGMVLQRADDALRFAASAHGHVAHLRR